MRKYSQIAIFGIVALLVTLPMTSSNVFAQSTEGKANLQGSCGITVPPSIDLGTLNAGSDGNEVEIVISTDGTLVSTLSVVADDWLGDDAKIHLDASVTKYSILTNGTSIIPSAYADKLSFGVKDASTSLSSDVTPASDIHLSLQISAANSELQHMPYSGALSQAITFTSSCTE